MKTINQMLSKQKTSPDQHRDWFFYFLVMNEG